MKINDEVIFTDQLLQKRTVGSQIEETRRSWEERCFWFWLLKMNFTDGIHRFTRSVAKRNRLREKYRIDTDSNRDREARYYHISMEHLNSYKASFTSNA
ncbi:hypothetical protein M5D96_004684 [Drosophila gunungcola]|uniref:Uncharacterized protein n=1 Tax=Drosophila gunungcola TaxID=103775 RepID=A0A9Q0BTI2_9MUSC|nr:hypothetical protein M5D96_004684 [Drosophila gunungcola]